MDSSRAFRKGNPDPSLPWNFSLALPRNQLPWNSHLAQSARVLIYPTENPSSLSRVGSFFRLCLGSERLEMLPRAPRSSGEPGQGSPSAPAPLPSSAEPTNGEKKSEKKRLEKEKLGIRARAQGVSRGWSRQMCWAGSHLSGNIPEVPPAHPRARERFLEETWCPCLEFRRKRRDRLTAGRRRRRIFLLNRF